MASFTKRGNVWQYEISTKNISTGKYTKIRKSGFKTKRDAQISANEMEVKLNNGYKLGSGDILLSDYFKEWMETYKKEQVSYRSYLKYINALNNILIYFPNETLKSLNKIKYQKALNSFSKTHSTGTVSRLNSYIRASLVNAVDEQIIKIDFTKGAVTKGSVEKKKETDKYLDYDDFKKLMSACYIDRDPKHVTKQMIFIAGMTGLRFGELSGLSWNDVDFENSTITVNKTYNQVLKEFGTPKTENSYRTITIDIKTKGFLEDYQKLQKQYIDSIDVKNIYNLVFFYPPTTSVSNNAAINALKRIQKRLGINNPITMHGLRHTHASVLLLKGVNVLAVSKRLGHKSIDITLNTYAHLLKELEEKEDEKIVNELKNML